MNFRSCRICLPILVFAAAFLAAKWEPRNFAGKPPSASAISPAAAGQGALATGSTVPGNAGLESLTAALARQLDPGTESFSGGQLEKLLADGNGTGEETPMSYASRWAHADPASLAE